MNCSDDLEEIAYNIGRFCVKWGRIHVSQTKEKYGTVRVYCSFGIDGLHGLIWPRYMYKHPKYPQWLWELDLKYSHKILAPLGSLTFRVQKTIYQLAYSIAILKYPHLFNEITSCMDWPEYIGWAIPRLCSECSEKYTKRCYLVNEGCDGCKIPKS